MRYLALACDYDGTLASGGRVDVLEHDPSGLQEDPAAGEPAVRQEPDIAAVDAHERARSTQTGL